MTTLLFLNSVWGVDFLLKRKLQNEKIEHPFISLHDEENKKESRELYKKYEIKSTPVLIVLDKEEEIDRIKGIEDILKYLKENKTNDV